MHSAAEFAELVEQYNSLLTKGAITDAHHKTLMAGLVKQQSAATAAKVGESPDDFDTSSMWDLRNLSRNKTLRQQAQWADRYVHLALEYERIKKAVNEPKALGRYRELAVGRAKYGLLSAIDLFILRPLLFSDDPLQGALTLIEMIFNTPSSDLIPLHNYLVLQDYSGEQRADLVARALDSADPLFPAAYFRELDDLPLHRAEPLQGDGAPARLFKPVEESGLMGSGYMAPLLSNDGAKQGVVDMSQLTDFLVTQFALPREEAKVLESILKRARSNSNYTASQNRRRHGQNSNNNNNGYGNGYSSGNNNWKSGNGRGNNV